MRCCGTGTAPRKPCAWGPPRSPDLRADEVLVRVRATSVRVDAWHVVVVEALRYLTSGRAVGRVVLVP